MYAIMLIGHMVATPFSSFALHTKLAWLLVRWKPSNINDTRSVPRDASETVKRKIFFEKFGSKPSDPERRELLKNMDQDFEKTKPLEEKGYFSTFLTRCSRKSKYSKLMEKVQNQIDKELDLQKYIHRVRLQVTTTLGILNTH